MRGLRDGRNWQRFSLLDELAEYPALQAQMTATLWPAGFGPDDLHDLRQYRLARLHAERDAPKPKGEDDVPPPDWGDHFKTDGERRAVQAAWERLRGGHVANVRGMGAPNLMGG